MGSKRKGRISDRLLGVKVKSVDNNVRRLVTEGRKVSGSKVKYVKTNFIVDTRTLIIGKGNKSSALYDIKAGNKINIDFIKTQDKKMLAKGINILD